jgi:hypothetical protein
VNSQDGPLLQPIASHDYGYRNTTTNLDDSYSQSSAMHQRDTWWSWKKHTGKVSGGSRQGVEDGRRVVDLKPLMLDCWSKVLLMWRNMSR